MAESFPGAQATARLLTQRLSSLLFRCGFYVARSSDLHYWESLLKGRGETVNSAFRPELHDEPADILVVHRGNDDAFAGTIAWRVLQTDDYVERRLRTGRQWIAEPSAVDWQPYEISGAPRIAGRIHDRGGLYVDPAFRGHRISWYLTGLQWAIALADQADFVVSQTLPKISATRLPQAVYGYEHFWPMPQHHFPWRSEAFAPALVWSDAQAIRDEVARRLRYLRQRYAQDLGDAARGYERYQQAIEGSESLAVPAVHK